MRRSEGMVLLLSLIIAFLGLVMVGILTQLFSSATWLSGSIKRYSIATEAAYGALEDFGADLKKAFVGVTDSSFFYGTWNSTALSKIESVNPEDDFSTNGTLSVDFIKSHCHWSGSYGDYKVCIYIAFTKTLFLQGGEVSVYQHNPSYAGVRKFIAVEIVAYKENTPERAWISAFEVLER